MFRSALSSPVAKLWQQTHYLTKNWNVHLFDLILNYLNYESVTEYICRLLSVYEESNQCTLLHQDTLKFNEGQRLHSGTNWSVSHTIIRDTVCLCHSNEICSGQPCTICVCVVLLPCLCCVMVNKDALGVIVYTYLLQLFKSIIGWSVTVVIIHTPPPALRYHI